MSFKRKISLYFLRTLLEKDFILNKTEFVAYLECPFKFYLLKELQKSKGEGNEVDHSHYESFLREGIKKHLWLQHFYKNYGTAIRKNLSPPLSEEDKDVPWKKAFLDFEVKRYQQVLEFWEPLAVELFLRNDSLCGKIDRIDQVDEYGRCRVVEYKSLPGKFDEEELLFYSFLLSNLLPFPELSNITEVSEIAVYYYKNAEYYSAQLTTDSLSSFSDYLEEIRDKMLDPYLIRKKKACDFTTTRCLYREICQRIHINQRKIFGLR